MDPHFPKAAATKWYEDPARRAFHLAVLTGNLYAEQEIEKRILAAKNSEVAQVSSSATDNLGSSEDTATGLASTASSCGMAGESSGCGSTRGRSTDDSYSSNQVPPGLAAAPRGDAKGSVDNEGGYACQWWPEPGKISSRQKDLMERGYKRPRGGQHAEYHTRMHQLKQQCKDKREKNTFEPHG